MMGHVDPWRESLLQAVRQAPGASTRQIAQALGSTEWTTDYHLRRLLRARLVTTEPIGRARCWYAASCGLCPVLKRAMPILRRPEAMAVALAAEDVPETLPRLAARAGVPVGTARWVASVLANAFVLERSRYGRMRLRRGASTCVAAAAEGRRCDLWGKCPVSRAWESLREETPPPAARFPTVGT